MKAFFKRGAAVLAAATLLLTVLLAACGGPKAVVLTAHDKTTYIATPIDYASMFDATIDGEPYAIPEAAIDASAVDLTKAGEYAVVCTLEVDGTEYRATATLTVLAAREVYISARSGVMTIGEDFDLTTLFIITANGFPYSYSADCIDLSEADLTKEGTYTVTLRITIDGRYHELTAELTVNAPVGERAPLAPALDYSYDNFTMTRTAEDKFAAYTEIRKAELYKYSYTMTADWREHPEQYAYECLENGYVEQGYFYDPNTQAWRRSNLGNEYVWYLSTAGLTEDDFSYLGGWYYPDEDLYSSLGIMFFGDRYSTFMDMRARVEDGKFVELYGLTTDGVTLHDVYTDFGTTKVELPFVEPVVEITAYDGEVFVGEESYDYASLFSIKVDDVSVPVTDDMLDYSGVDLSVAGEYEVTLRFTAEKGTVEHTAKAKFTVKSTESPATFEEAFAALAANCTVSKTTSSSSTPTMFYWDGEYCYTTGTYDYLYHYKDGALQQAQVKDGVVGAFSSSSAKIPLVSAIAAVAADFTDSDGDGVYTYTGSQLAALHSACVNIGTPTSIEVTFEHGTIISIQFNYVFFNKDNYHLYTITSVGKTELPVTPPQG